MMKDDNHPPSEQTVIPENPAELAAEAQRLGLRLTRAWVQDKPAKSRSPAAERTKRHREKAERLGIKQLSVSLPVDLHGPVKALATRVQAGEPVAQVWADLAPAESRTSAPASVQAASTNSGGWRGWLLRWLLPRRLRVLIE